MVGALSRLNNNHQNLGSDAKKMLRASKLKLPSKNPFHDNIAEAIEIVHCIDESLKILDSTDIKNEPVDKMQVKAGNGISAIEVPRGTLWHEYTLNEKGIITNASIITPTAQNLLSIQEDIRNFAPQIIKKSKEEIKSGIEKLIRSYDPCFSCSAHFLELKWA